jgi:lactate dehydrogenase-like 2-hydroxyacid dehydrogenase
LLLAGNIPLELRRVLEPNYDLVARASIAGATAPIFQVAVTTSMDGADAALMDFLPNLRLIACNGTGLERIDLDAARRRGIAVCNTPDAVTEDTADFAIGLMYAVSRRLVEADRFVRAGLWKEGKMTPSRRLFDKAIGIVGLGKIGRSIAKRSAALGMRTAYTAMREKSDVPFAYVPTLRQLATQSDVLVMACPGGDATRHLVNSDTLACLGGSGILINVSRGSVVDESALIHALETGAIAGAGLDVFEREPNVDERLFAFENVVLSPHYASATHETRAAIAEDLRANIEAFFAGKAVRNAAG